ncbi:MAG: RluA family pseudouridine synthase [Eubacteriales bacterium]|nr:RluA family pseudouridine synthase [Eubacteriales bacterium]
MDDVRVRRDTQAVAGAEIKIYLSDECSVRSPEIIYEDRNLMVVDKPAGISCEADDIGGMTIGEWVYQTNRDRLEAEPTPCHRLDNPTDGLLILAKNPETQLAMQNAFRERRVHKNYICLVRGTPSPRHAVLDAYLVKDEKNATVYVADKPGKNTLSIRTEYRVLEAGPVSRLEITLHTGRTHQIRAQLAHIGHPVLGDDKYGDRAFNREYHAKRLMLTAVELRFDLTGELAYLNNLQISVKTKF